jgi:hypothetical protein
MWAHALLFTMIEEVMDFPLWCDPTPLEVTLEAILADVHPFVRTVVKKLKFVKIILSQKNKIKINYMLQTNTFG